MATIGLADPGGSRLVAAEAPDEGADDDHDPGQGLGGRPGQVVEDVLERGVPGHRDAGGPRLGRGGEEGGEGEGHGERRTSGLTVRVSGIEGYEGVSS